MEVTNDQDEDHVDLSEVDGRVGWLISVNIWSLVALTSIAVDRGGRVDTSFSVPQSDGPYHLGLLSPSAPGEISIPCDMRNA